MSGLSLMTAEECERKLRERTALCMRAVCPGYCGSGIRAEPAARTYWDHAGAYCLASPIHALFPDIDAQEGLQETEA